MQLHKCKQLARTKASAFPPELFKYICGAADSESWSLRLVCRHWNEQCTSHVFEHIDAKGSPERIRALWKVREHPTFRQHVRIVDELPQSVTDQPQSEMHRAGTAQNGCERQGSIRMWSERVGRVRRAPQDFD